MKKIFNIFSIAACLAGLASCETYKVAEPDMTAVCDVDGAYVTFGYESGSSEPSALFHIEITNTTNNDSDKIWMTVTDCDNKNGYYLDAVRFLLSYDASTNSFSCTDYSCSQPRTCYNMYYEQHYYTYGYRKGNSTYVINVSGKVTKDGVTTKTGYKSDAIEFTYSRKYKDDTVKSYTVKGMKNTGWAADLVDYQAFIDKHYN